MKKLRVGIFGAGRGSRLGRDFIANDCEIVAICDNIQSRREDAVKLLKCEPVQYDNFDDFIEHDMDMVVLANLFNEHTPYAIRCFEKGLHVYCECISNATMAEGVELIKAFEKSNSIFMLAENYPHSINNREMKRVCDGGTLGKILYAEGEYNHPGDPWDANFNKFYVYREDHWRNFCPVTYYLTHSLAPLMWASGATPKRVTAMAAYAPETRDVPNACYVGDATAIMNTINDDGSLFRFVGCSKFGAHHNSYRVCGTDGQFENVRGMDNKVMLRYNEWSKPEGMPATCMYDPEWNDPDENKIRSSGHGGGDYLAVRMFVDCVKAGKQPEHPFDIYSAVTMASVGILAWRSVLEGGAPYDIPDFRKEEDCKKYENDRLSPFYGVDGSAPTLPSCSHPDYKPTERQLELYRDLIKSE